MEGNWKEFKGIKGYFDKYRRMKGNSTKCKVQKII